jgi:hypothetical protein
MADEVASDDVRDDLGGVEYSLELSPRQTNLRPRRVGHDHVSADVDADDPEPESVPALDDHVSVDCVVLDWEVPYRGRVTTAV